MLAVSISSLRHVQVLLPVPPKSTEELAECRSSLLVGAANNHVRQVNSSVSAVINCQPPQPPQCLLFFMEQTMAHLSIMASKRTLTIKLFKKTTTSEVFPIFLSLEGHCGAMMIHSLASLLLYPLLHWKEHKHLFVEAAHLVHILCIYLTAAAVFCFFLKVFCDHLKLFCSCAITRNVWFFAV